MFQLEAVVVIVFVGVRVCRPSMHYQNRIVIGKYLSTIAMIVYAIWVSASSRVAASVDLKFSGRVLA